MSLINVSSVDGEIVSVNCARCGVWCFAEELGVVADMCKRGATVHCWDCDRFRSDTLPPQVYYLDDKFLLGVGGEEFLMYWWTDSLEIEQRELRAVRIPSDKWCDLRGGKGVVLRKKA